MPLAVWGWLKWAGWGCEVCCDDVTKGVGPAAGVTLLSEPASDWDSDSWLLNL